MQKGKVYTTLMRERVVKKTSMNGNINQEKW
jgi:hypothetical protein